MADPVDPVIGTVPGQQSQPDRAPVARSPVDSRHLASVGYDDQAGVLAVGFKDGEVYEYFGVSMETYMELLTAKSIGKFFYDHIRSNFKSRQIA
jgi:hypothetical protein